MAQDKKQSNDANDAVKLTLVSAGALLLLQLLASAGPQVGQVVQNCCGK